MNQLQNGLNVRPHLCPLPRERILPITFFVSANNHPANPVAGYAEERGT